MKPLTLRSKFLPGALEGLRTGDRGPRVLALHGWLDNAHSFLPLAGFLDDIELVCLEFPGHGHSPPRPAGTRYSFDDYVFDVLGAADTLGWERFHLLGHSLGGAVSTVLAAACPRRVQSLNLIEGLGPLSTSPHLTAAGWQDAVDQSRNRPRRIHPDVESAAAARSRNSDLTLEAARLLAGRGLDAAEDGFYWRHDLRLTWPSAHRYTEPQVLNLLGAIECPVLNVWAEPRTRVLTPGLLERRLAALATVRNYSLPGGHHVHMESPERLAPVIMDHITSRDDF